jgi:hypothetical protein
MKYPTKLLDEMWQTVCKTRDGYKCQVCGKAEYVNVHHIIGRQNYGTRWLPENGICLCPSHHKFSRTDSAHINPLWFISQHVTGNTEEFLKKRCHDEKNPEYYYETLCNELAHYYTPTCAKLLAKCHRFHAKATANDKRRTERSADRAARKLARSTGDNRNGT